MRIKSNKEAAMELKRSMAGAEKSTNVSANSSARKRNSMNADDSNENQGAATVTTAESSSTNETTSDSSSPAEAQTDRTLRRQEKKRRKKEASQAASEADAGKIHPSRSIAHTRPLIILDLNGILCHRIRDWNLPNGSRFRRSIGRIANTEVVPRSDLHDFLGFLHRNFTLAVWTSATYKTARKLVRALFPEGIGRRLAFVWSRSYCDLTEKSEDSKCDEKGSDSKCDAKGSEDESKSTDVGCSKQGSECEEKEESKDYFKFDVFYEALRLFEKGTSNETSKVETRGGNDRDILSDKRGKTEDSNGVRGKKTASCNKKGEGDKKLSHEDVTAMKSLSKVWAAYPRWNASNTILIDDSPEKIPIEHRGNVLHPPPIRGTVTPDSSNVMKDDDVVNQTTQANFFNLLAKHWDEPTASAKEKLVAFLEEHADGHNMRWEKGLVS